MQEESEITSSLQPLPPSPFLNYVNVDVDVDVSVNVNVDKYRSVYKDKCSLNFIDVNVYGNVYIYAGVYADVFVYVDILCWFCERAWGYDFACVYVYVYVYVICIYAIKHINMKRFLC